MAKVITESIQDNSKNQTPESGRPGSHPRSIINMDTDLSKLVNLQAKMILNV